MRVTDTSALKELLDFASNPLRERLELVIKLGSIKKASDALGLDESAIRHAITRLKKSCVKLGYIKSENNPIIEHDIKILFIDIETAPTKAYVWKMWKENIAESQVTDHGYIMCFTAKWLGSDEVIYGETRTEDDSHITKQIIDLFDQADYVIAHNADRFDVPRINTAAIVNGIKPPSPYKVIDTLRIAKKHFKFERNTLSHLADILGCTPKLKHTKFAGFHLWDECLKGNNEAWQEMMEYNIQDVYTLEEVYLKLRPYHKEHPNVSVKAESSEPLCSKCGSSNILMNGYTVTDISKFELYRCQECGGFSRGRSNKYPKIIRNELLTTVR